MIIVATVVRIIVMVLIILVIEQGKALLQCWALLAVDASGWAEGLSSTQSSLDSNQQSPRTMTFETCISSIAWSNLDPKMKTEVKIPKH